MSTTIKIRRDLAARWLANNPTPAVGEFCLVTDTTPQRFKIGDGITKFNSLPYFTLPEATTSDSGLLSASDKTKLDGIPDNIVGEADALDIAARAIGMAVLVEFTITSTGTYTLCDATKLRLMAINGHGYKVSSVRLTPGNYTGAFVFANPTVIPANAFKTVSVAKAVHIPSWVHEIGSAAFAGTRIDTVKCEAMTPPTLEVDAFDDLSALSVFVHKVVLGSYEIATNWDRTSIRAF